jgi:predicted transcriptional regulator
MADAETILPLTADIVANYVAANNIAASELPSLIRNVYGALSGDVETSAPPSAAVKLTSAQIRKSITTDRLVSFEDGKGYRMLKRHLTLRDLTPAAYREKWGLPKDYPMVAPSYSAARSDMAKKIGLGQRGRGRGPVAPPPGRRKTTKT